MKRWVVGLGCLIIGMAWAGGRDWIDWIVRASATRTAIAAWPMQKAGIGSDDGGALTEPPQFALPASAAESADASSWWGVQADAPRPSVQSSEPREIPGFRLNPVARVPEIPITLPRRSAIPTAEQQAEADATIAELRRAVAADVAARRPASVALSEKAKSDPEQLRRALDAAAQRVATRFRRPGTASAR